VISHVMSCHVIQPDEVRVSKMIGGTVYDLHNRDIGKVSDLVLNKHGAVDAVVIDVGTFLDMGSKYVAIPIGDIKADNNRLTSIVTGATTGDGSISARKSGHRRRGVNVTRDGRRLER